jgi:hypothetical protein
MAPIRCEGTSHIIALLEPSRRIALREHLVASGIEQLALASAALAIA